jgi:hypothetical protein
MIDLDRYGIADKWPRLRKKQEEVANLERRRGEAEQEVLAGRDAIPAAQERDAEAAAKAIRAGKSVPEPGHEVKARAQLEAAERTAAAFTKAAADAQSELDAFIAGHRDELRAAMVAALNANDQAIAYHAQEAQRRYAFREDARYDLKAFAPPPSPPDENAPAQKLSTSVIAIGTQRSVGPARGEVEQMLAYLASLAELPSEPAVRSGAA